MMSAWRPSPRDLLNAGMHLDRGREASVSQIKLNSV